MSYIVIGATGHIGNNITRKLVDLKLDVKVLVRRVDKSISNLPITYCIGDIFDKDFLNVNINSDDIVIHAAGMIDVKNKFYEQTMKVNYELTKIVCDLCIKKNVKKFIYFSSVDCIYKEDADSKIVEPTEIHPEKFDNNYGYSKAMGTKYVLDKIKENPNLDFSILYPSSVMGSNDYKPSLIGKVILDSINNKTQFGINGGYDFIDVEDVATATVNLACSDKHGSYLLTGKKSTIIEVYQAINKVLNRKKKIFRIPLPIVYLFIPFVPYLSRTVFAIIKSNFNYDNSKAISELGIEITPLEKTIEKTIAFFNKEKGVK